jgi:8-oxo-dGTP diphosphatase
MSIPESATHFAVGVVAIIHDGSRLLMLRRSPDDSRAPGMWETVAGHLEIGEEPENAVRREIQEECGINVRVCDRPLGVFLSTHDGPTIVLIYYLAEYKSGSIRLSAEHSEYEWLCPSDFERRSSFPKLAELAAKHFLPTSSFRNSSLSVQTSAVYAVAAEVGVSVQSELTSDQLRAD